MKIAICDDDKYVTSEIERYILEIAKNKNWDIDIDVFFDGAELINYIEIGNNYDIIYLDIEMNQKDGVKTARELREQSNEVIIIYVTSHESFAIEVFEVDAFRFLTKPIDYNKFKKYLYDAVKKLEKRPDYFQCKYKKISYRIPLSEIQYFQSDKRVTYIITSTTEYKCYDRLNDIERKLCNSKNFFYRTHQSFLINPRYVRVYTYDSMELMDGTILAISERRRKQISELFCKLKGEDIVTD